MKRFFLMECLSNNPNRIDFLYVNIAKFDKNEPFLLVTPSSATKFQCKDKVAFQKVSDRLGTHNPRNLKWIVIEED